MQDRGRRVRAQRPAFRAAARRREPRRASSCPCPASTTPATPPPASRPASSSGSIPSTPGGRSPASPGSRGASSSAARSAASPSSTTTPTCPARCAPPSAAAPGGGFERIVCVFQPHRYSRVATLAPEFADAFEGADLVVVTDIYAAGEAPRPGVSGKLVLDAIVQRPSRPPGRVYVPNREDLVAYLRTILRPGDCASPSPPAT